MHNLKIWKFEDLKIKQPDTNLKMWKFEDLKIKQPIQFSTENRKNTVGFPELCSYQSIINTIQLITANSFYSSSPQ